MSKNFTRPRPHRLGQYKLVVGASAITFTTEFINLYFAGKPIYRSWDTGYGPLVTDRVGQRGA